MMRDVFPGSLLIVACVFVAACSSDEDVAARGTGGAAGSSAVVGSGGSITAGNAAIAGSAGVGGGGASEGGAAGSTHQPDPFSVVADGRAVDIFVDAVDDPAVIRAVNDLQTDIERVSGVLPKVKNSTSELSSRAIFVGTLGKSPTIDALVATGKLNVSDVKGRWESFAVQAVDAPVDGVERALVIAGSDRRGSIFGVYDISEAVGVSPWHWWADVAPLHQDVVMVDGAPRQHGEPSIKYRGIFINDEENLAAWSGQLDPGKKMGPETYKKVFELLLRLKANLLWPANHKVSDPFAKYPENAKNADAYGVVIHTSFANVKEWNSWASTHPVDGVTPTYDYSVYPKVVYDWWDSLVAPTGQYEGAYCSFGMRGHGDKPMLAEKAPTTEDKVALIGKILEDQQELVTKRVASKFGPPLKAFMPYKEALELYNAGVVVPDDVTLLWPEDNHGYVRQIPSDAERKRGGGSGTYYHLSYWGPPNQSYLWLNSTPLTLVREELQKALDTGAKEVLVLNVGDIKPAEIGIEFAMRFAYRASDYGESNVAKFVERLAARDFSPDYAPDIAEIVMSYFQINIARRPEFMKKGVYSVLNFGDESNRRLTELTDLERRAEAISKKLPASRADAFYEMVLFPLRASRLTLQKYVSADLTDAYALQGRRKSVKKRQDVAKAAHASVMAELEYYNTKLASGKWNKIMNPFNTQAPVIEAVPALADVPAAATGSALGVVVEGQAKEGPATLQFSTYTEDVRFVDIFSKTDAGFTWSAAVSNSWIKLSKSSGTIDDEQRLLVSIDWAAVPSGASTGTITISAASTTKVIDVKVSNPATPSKTELTGYVEANGYVAIEAEHFSANSSRGGAEWRVQTGLGRNGDSVKIFPDLSSSITDQFMTKSASLDYKIYFFSTGKFEVTIYRLPTLNALGQCRLALSLDDSAAKIVSGVNSVNDTAWRTTLLEHIEKLTTTIEVKTPGYHTLHLFKVDPSMIVDRIVINTGGLQPSYMGPPESYRH
jgi:hypothetical protein